MNEWKRVSDCLCVCVCQWKQKKTSQCKSRTQRVNEWHGACTVCTILTNTQTIYTHKWRRMRRFKGVTLNFWLPPFFSPFCRRDAMLRKFSFPVFHRIPAVDCAEREEFHSIKHTHTHRYSRSLVRVSNFVVSFDALFCFLSHVRISPVLYRVYLYRNQ